VTSAAFIFVNGRRLGDGVIS